jgi:hypothetical protein
MKHVSKTLGINIKHLVFLSKESGSELQKELWCVIVLTQTRIEPIHRAIQKKEKKKGGSG